MAHMAGVLPCKAEGERRGCVLYGTEKVECTELSLGIDDVCKNLEHPGAKGDQIQLAHVQGLPLQGPEQSIPTSSKSGKNARMDTKIHTQK